MPWSEFRKTNIWAESYSRAFIFYFILSLFIFLSAQALTGKAKRAKTSDFGCDVFRSAAMKTHDARGCSTQPCAHALKLKLCSPTAPVSTAVAKPQSATSKKVWSHRLCHNVLTG